MGAVTRRIHGNGGILARKLTDRRRDYESLSVGSTPTERTMGGRISKRALKRFQKNLRLLAEAELEQHQPPKLENAGSNPACESGDSEPRLDAGGQL